MGKLLFVAFAAAVGLPLACPVEPPPEPGPCPAAGPCEEGQDVDDHGFCPDDGTWTPCVTVAGAGDGADFCGLAFNDGTVEAVSCAECKARWLEIDLGRTNITCPDLPSDDVVVAD